MVHFGEFLKTWSLRSNSVTRQVSFDRTKIGEKCQNSKIQKSKRDILSNFQTIWERTEFVTIGLLWCQVYQKTSETVDPRKFSAFFCNP